MTRFLPRPIVVWTAARRRRAGRLRAWFALAAVTGALSLSPLACSKATGSPTEPTPDSPVVYAAIGASDALGVGASVICLPFTECPDGTGYVPQIARQLASGGREVSVTNLGIPAAVLSPTIEDLGNQYNRGIPGNFLEQEMPFVPRGSTLVTIFAGGNDTNTLGTAVTSGEGGSNPLGWIDSQVRQFSEDYQALVRGIRDRAPSATIVIANLPNFAGMPFTQSYSLEKRQIIQRISVALTTQAINPFAAQGIPVVDLLCDERMYDPSIYSLDGFHPNDTGYGLLATEMLRAVGSPAAYPAPQPSCAAMLKVPAL